MENAMTIRRVTAALTVAIGITVAGGSAVYAPPAQAWCAPIAATW